MKFDVIIATYNRKDSLHTLVNQIHQCTQLPENIIIVDSSNTENNNIKGQHLVNYIQSKHKNQAYQRYLGFLLSKNDILVYFDDDMRILDHKCFTKIISTYKNENIIGVQPNFSYENLFFDKKMPISKTRSLAKKNKFFHFFKTLSGNPDLNAGAFGFSGIRGSKPKNNETLEWFNGPVFSAKKKFLYNNFNFNLFTFYEDKIGKSEDSVLGFTLSKFGEIVYIDELLFKHDDQNDSSYAVDFVSHSTRVAYSRLYLSFEYARQSKISLVKAFLHFNLHILGRITSMILNQLIDFKLSRIHILKGYFKGYIKALMDLKKLKNFDSGLNWNKEAVNEINLDIKTKKFQNKQTIIDE
jgi:glycosyltransferase involved in cell wall biosynthesis|tara:strand:+ start:2051 stop:3115 length:1065 start_codon:yes stop_codon:yes gene_type:complete